MSESRSEPLAHRSRLQRDLLAAIQRLEGPTGQDLRETLSDRYADRLRNNRVYRNLRRLEDLGLVDADRSGRCNVYRLTELGESRTQRDAEWRTQR